MAMARIDTRVLAVVGVLALACERPAPPPPPAKARGAEGLPEVKRARAELEKAHEAAQKRTDDALDRAMQGEQVERGGR